MKDNRKKSTKREILLNTGKLRAEFCNPEAIDTRELVLRKNHIPPITFSIHCRERVLHLRYHPKEKETTARATH